MSRLPAISHEPLQRARLQFIEGAPAPTALLGATLARSWTRSREAGIMPWHPPCWVPAERSRDPLADRHLRSCVEAEMEILWQAFGGRSWALYCVNRDGGVVHARHAMDSHNPVCRVLSAGLDVSEAVIGTTAPSCVLQEGALTIVEGNQHYLQDFDRLFCLSVPVYGCDGEVIGALDITGEGERDVMFLRQHFQQAAWSAEINALRSLRRCHLLRLQHDPRLLSTPLAGLIAVQEDRSLRGASRLARQMLGLPAQGSVRGIDLDQLLPGALPAQRRRLLQPSKSPLRIGCPDASQLWLHYERAPLQGRRASHPRALPSAPASLQPEPVLSDWREQGLRAMAAVIAAHDGNLAAAARQLRISRTTLYRKLPELRQYGCV